MTLRSICLCVVMVIFCLCITSDSPYSEHGTLDEVDHDGGTEAHTSEDGMIFFSCLPINIILKCHYFPFILHSLTNRQYRT